MSGETYRKARSIAKAMQEAVEFGLRCPPSREERAKLRNWPTNVGLSGGNPPTLKKGQRK